jgi:hypothetical protein
MALYDEYQSKLSPPWLRRSLGEKIQRALGAEADDFQDRVRQGILSNLPDQGPADALVQIGADRLLPRGGSELEAAYRERLRLAWDTWPLAGSHGGLLRALDVAGFPMGTATGANIIQRTRRYTYLTASGGSVNYATHNGWSFNEQGPAYWNQFGIVFGGDVPSLLSEVGANKLNEIVRLWKPAKARYIGAWVVTTSPVWGWPISTTWGQATLDWGESGSFFVSP